MQQRSAMAAKVIDTDAIVIRDIEDQDIEQVIALWHSAGVARPWNDAGKDISRARESDHSTILLALMQDKVVATALVGEDGYRGWAYYVAVDPHFKGNGLGREIMDAVEEWLRERDIWKLNLLVSNDNDQTLNFYQHLGYSDSNTLCLHKILKPNR